MTLWLWYLWLRVCPYGWRDSFVPGWKELRVFVETWMESDAAKRPDVAYAHLGGRDVGPERLRRALQGIGSLTRAFRLVHRGRPLTWDEKVRFSTHAKPAGLVDWQHIASGTAGLLGALYMMPAGTEE